MELFETIKNRYSYRECYTNDPVPETDLRKIVQAGLDAPSGKNEQTTRFIIVNDASKIKQMLEILPCKKCFDSAKAFILCIVDQRPEALYAGFHFQIEDCSAAVENMLLAITALGYASVWIDGVLRVQNRAEALGKLFNVPEGKKIQILLPVGVPEKEGPRKEKMSFEERAWFNQYQGKA